MPKTKPVVPVFLFDILGGAPASLNVAAPVMSNWMNLHAFIKSTSNTRAGMQILAKLMIAEYQRKPGPRMDIIMRLYGKFTRVRYEVERVELGTR